MPSLTPFGSKRAWRNTLAAYRRDLTLYATWLQLRDTALDATSEADLNAYFAAPCAAVPHRPTGG
jgi:site-specific recombinase XerD